MSRGGGTPGTPGLLSRDGGSLDDAAFGDFHGGGGGGGEDGGSRPLTAGEAELVELRGKRTRGNVSTDSTFGTTGEPPVPPPKAKPSINGATALEVGPQEKFEGGDAAVPYQADSLEIVQPPTRGEGWIPAVLHTLYRYSEESYVRAVQRKWVVNVPKHPTDVGFGGPGSMERLRPGFQFLACLARGMKARRATLVHDIREVEWWHARYEKELGFLEEKKRSRHARREDLGKEIFRFAEMMEYEPGRELQCLLECHEHSRKVFFDWAREAGARAAAFNSENVAFQAQQALKEQEVAAEEQRVCIVCLEQPGFHVTQP